MENEVVRLRTNINSLENALRTAEQSAVSSEVIFLLPFISEFYNYFGLNHFVFDLQARFLQVQRRSENVSFSYPKFIANMQVQRG